MNSNHIISVFGNRQLKIVVGIIKQTYGQTDVSTDYGHPSDERKRTYTVKRLIIGDYLFGEIGEFFKFAKISCHQIGTLQSLDITSVGNRQIKSLPNCHI